MKKNYFSVISFLISILTYGQQLNEFEPNPNGADPSNQNFELSGTPSAAFSGWIISIESDNDGSSGIVDRATMVSGSFDTNGLLVVSVPDLENPSFTIVLVDTFTGTTGSTDLDTDNDGTVDDTSSFGTVFDAIGIPDNSGDEAYLYGTDLGGQDLKFTGDEPRLVFRDSGSNNWFAVNDVTGDTTDEIYSLNAELADNGGFSSNPAAGASFGAPNPTNPSLSVKEKQIEDFNLYPNPTSKSFVTIESKSNAAMNVKVYDILGKEVITQKVTNKRLDVANLNTGVYIMSVEQENAFATRKLVVR